MILSITRNFTSRRAISDFRRGQQHKERLASAFAGTNGIRKRRGSPHFVERRFYFIQPPLAGIRRKRRSSARPNILPGKRFSAATPSRTAATLRRRTASGMKRLRVGTESSFGDKALSRRRVARSLPRVRWIEKKLSWPTWNG